MMRRTLSGVIGLALCWPAALVAQNLPYRPGQPDTINGLDADLQRAGTTRRQDTAKISADFTAAYLRAGKPRLALFWNQDFSQRLAEWEPVIRVTERTDERSTGTRDGRPNTGSYSSVSATELHVRNQSTSERRMDALDAADFESGFFAALASSNAVLIDRDTTMRRAALDQPGADFAALETRGLMQHADMVLDVAMLPDSASYGGYTIHTRVRDLKQGRLVADIVTKPTRPSQTDRAGRWEAKAGGFVFIEDRQQSALYRLGQHTGYDMMSQLSRVW